MDIDDEEASFKERRSFVGLADLAEACKVRCGIKYIIVLVVWYHVALI